MNLPKCIQSIFGIGLAKFIQQIFSDSLNKSVILEMELKLGKYQVLAKAVDNMDWKESMNWRLLLGLAVN